MRFVVVQRGNRWLVKDTELSKTVGSFATEEEANLAAANLEASTPPVSADRDWEIAAIGSANTKDELLDNGYEPFAVDNGIIYFRKWIGQGQQP